jgi:hypothetical protein
MNIGNFKSVADKDAKQKLQAEYLQLLIDNQAELEKRVKNYQNPNAPPPVPPQYKTASELEKDAMKQEKDVIDNVLSLSPSLSFSDASSVAEDLRSRGLDALVKFNRNFPIIKKRLAEEVNPKLLNAQVIITKIDDIFGKIDATFGLNPSGYKSENFFARSPQDILEIYPTSDLIVDILNDIRRCAESVAINVNPNQQASLDNLGSELAPILREMIDYLPSEAQLNFITYFKPIDRDELSKIIQQTLIEKVVPDKKVLVDLEYFFGDVLSAIQEGETHIEGSAYGQVASSENRPPEDTNIDDYLDQELNLILGETETGIPQSRTTASSRLPASNPVAPTQNVRIQPRNLPPADDVDKLIKGIALLLNNVSGFGDRAKFLLSKFKEKYDKYNAEINTNILKPTGILDELDEEEQSGIKKKSYVPIGELGDIKNTRIAERKANQEREVKRGVFEGLKENTRREKKEREHIQNRAQAFRDLSRLGERVKEHERIIEEVTPKIIKTQAIVRGKLARTEKKRQEQQEARLAYEGEIIQSIVDRVRELTPQQLYHALETGVYRIREGVNIKQLTREQKEKELAHNIVAYNSERIRNGEYDPVFEYKGVLRKSIGLGFTSVDEPRLRTSLDQVSRVPNTQQESTFAPSSTQLKRIKVGAGVKLRQDEPRYKEFGKYRIHIPLLDENVINIKYPSLAGIPSLKPIQVSDQYIDFVKELLDTGDINHKKYNSLHEKEQDHFAKISKASGLANQFGIKPKSETEDDKDYDRLMILKGEWEAGNDNEKLVKELRQKIIKFINNGRINRKKGLDYLMQLSV